MREAAGARGSRGARDPLTAAVRLMHLMAVSHMDLPDPDRSQR